MCRCLYCYRPLPEGQTDFHPACARKFFGIRHTPALEYSRDDLDELARKVIQAQTSLTGVQPKLSLNLDRHEGASRLTIVGLWGDFIFKPQADGFTELPENEDLTMHMAEAVRISVVPHSLVRLADGSLGYITRRIDRTEDGMKIDMEDMCQLTLHPTEYKYRSSYEQIGKTIARYSSTPRLCLANFIQVLLFCYVTGNNDMHLKNFSLYSPPQTRSGQASDEFKLSPAYDLLNAALANPGDKEELALTLNGKRARLKRSDFILAASTMGIEEKTVCQMIASLGKALPKWEQLIKDSFLSEEAKGNYWQMVKERMERLA